MTAVDIGVGLASPCILGILEVEGYRADSEISILESFGFEVAIDSILEEAFRGIERDVLLLCKLLYIFFSLAP